MIDLIRAEIIRFRSVRSTLVVLFGAIAITVLFAVLEAHDLASAPRTVHLGEVNAGASLSAFLFGALGVQVIGQEYRFNTIRSTFAATPNRPKVVAAKLLVVTVACALAALVMMVLAGAVGTLLVDRFAIDGLDLRVVGGTALFAAGWSAMGLGVGAIVRQPIAGILILLGEGFVGEQIIRGVFEGTGPWLPFLNGVQMMTRDRPEDLHLRSVLGGGAYFFAVAAVVLAVGIVLVERRDA